MEKWQIPGQARDNKILVWWYQKGKKYPPKTPGWGHVKRVQESNQNSSQWNNLSSKINTDNIDYNIDFNNLKDKINILVFILT